jgi:predicted O-methyltransferase YrrM
MALDISFLRIAAEAFDPYRPGAGTEQMAPLLYTLVRMIRPITVVEAGSGYSTLFLLRALADNVNDIDDEARFLREKSASLQSGNINDVNFNGETWENWYAAGGKACGVDPSFYMKPYQPHLYSFEELPEQHVYSRTMKSVVAKLGHASLLSQMHGAFRVESLPQQVDFAWNDQSEYVDFFQALWPRLNPKGGIIVFHNVAASTKGWEAIQSIKKLRAEQDDLEILMIPEPHKLGQSSCAILRRHSSYRPPLIPDRKKVMENLKCFLANMK